MGFSFSQVFAQDLGNTDLVEYHTNKDKEPRPLSTESTTGAGSSPIKATKQSPNRPNSTTHSNLREHKTVTPQKVLLLQAKPGREEETSGVTTSNSPHHQNIHKSTNDTDNEDIINITTSGDDGSEDNNKSILPPTSYSAGMHTSGDNTDGQDGPNLLDTDEDDNKKIQNN